MFFTSGPGGPGPVFNGPGPVLGGPGPVLDGPGPVGPIVPRPFIWAYYTGPFWVVPPPIVLALLVLAHRPKGCQESPFLLYSVLYSAPRGKCSTTLPMHLSGI